MPARFIPLSQVEEILSISSDQAYALVRTGELKAIKVGGRGQWRVELSAIEDFIAAKYRETQQSITEEQQLSAKVH